MVAIDCIVTGNSAVYTIDQVEPSDAGTYTCTAENEVGSSGGDLELDILCKCEVDMLLDPDLPIE